MSEIDALSKAVEVVSTKQRWLIMHCLLMGSSTFNQLKKECGDPNSTTLSRTLRFLERKGVLKRRVESRERQYVEYSLTDLGKQFANVVNEMTRWGRKIENSRFGAD